MRQKYISIANLRSTLLYIWYVQRIIIFLWFLTSFGFLQAQKVFEVKTGPQIQVGEFELVNGFIGGLNSPQFTEFDLDRDGRNDLIVFDRADFKLYTFLRTQKNQFVYAPQFESQLPNGQNIYVARDMNSDGLLDIFTTSEGGDLLIFVNQTKTSDLKLSFRGIGPWYYRNQFPDNYTILYNPLSFGNAYTDLLGIEDIDNDGDIDIVDYDQFNLTYMMFKDVRVEKNWSNDTFEFQNMDYCFGYFWEGFDAEIRLNRCPFDLNFPLKLKPRHVGGASCWFYDEDGDGDMEMYMANLDFKRVTRLVNGKSDFNHDYDTMILVDTMFLDGKSFDSYVFPAGYMIDVNGDGLKDMVIAPNAAIESKEKNQIHYYKNHGTKQKADFKLERDNFIVEQMLDLGGFTSPSLADLDGDGDKDLLVLSNGDYSVTQGLHDRIAYFENQGGIDNPVFKLKESNFLGLSDSSIINGSLATGDIDNDGNLDLLIGTLSGQLFWFENEGGAWKYRTSQLLSLNMASGESSWSPAMIDYNSDGITDLLIGFYNGNVALLKGKGAVNSVPQFELITKSAWGIKSNEWLENLSDPTFSTFGYASPAVGDIDFDGNLEIVVGGFNNVLRVYHIENHDPFDSLIAEENILFNSFNGDTTQYKIGGRLKPCLGNLAADSVLELIVGNIKGGLTFATHIKSQPTSIDVANKQLNFQPPYPNPVKQGNRLTVPTPNSRVSWGISIHDLSGKCVYTGVINVNEPAISIETNSLGKGFYFIEYQDYSTDVKKGSKLIITD